MKSYKAAVLLKQNLDLQQILKETKRAKLTHFIRGREPEIDILLMKIRRELLSQ